jgi:hypothetical protein
MTVIGCILAGMGLLAGLTGEIMILTAVYRRGAILFITCLVIPLAAWAFAIVHIRRLWVPFLLSLGGCILAWTGVWLTGSEEFTEALFG